MKEIQIQNEIRAELNKGNTRAFRNNVGVAKIRGVTVKFGLAVGSSDLIGFHTMTIKPHHIGRNIAVFLAIECKSATGKPSQEQTNFIEFIKSKGGIAGIARSTSDAVKLITEYTEQ